MDYSIVLWLCPYWIKPHELEIKEDRIEGKIKVELQAVYFHRYLQLWYNNLGKLEIKKRGKFIIWIQ